MISKSLVTPTIVPFDFGETPVDTLDTASVTCVVSKGDTPIDIQWHFNNGKIHSNDGVMITKASQKTSILTIESARARHAGNYTCIARNKAGQTEHSSELHVIGKLVIYSFHPNTI